MSTLKQTVVKAGIALLRAIYAVMKLFPVKRRYVFLTKLSYAAPQDFTVLAQALRKAHPDHEVVMLCHPIDSKVRYVFHMFKQMAYLATSEVVFLERSCLPVHILKHRDSLQVVQLWHALGSMKKFGYAILDTPEGQTRQMAELFRMHRGYTSILISSYSFLRDFEEGFGLTHEQAKSMVWEIPLPRVGRLLDKRWSNHVRYRILRDYPQIDESKKTVLYCPTFRKNRSKHSTAHLRDLIEAIDFNRYNLVYSPHPVDAERFHDSRVVVPRATSQDLLHVADIVVSDYSSIIYEAGLLDLPVYLYAYDWEEYRSNRTHNLDLEHDVPAPFCRTARGLLNAVENNEFEPAAFAAFIKVNVALPEKGSCCDAIIKKIDAEQGKVRK